MNTKMYRACFVSTLLHLELFQISQYVLYTCADLGEIFFRLGKV